MRKTRYTMTVVVNRIAGDYYGAWWQDALEMALRKALNLPLWRSTLVECIRERDLQVGEGWQYRTFIAYGNMARHAQDFMVPGDTYLIEYETYEGPENDYEGIIIGIRDLSNPR